MIIYSLIYQIKVVINYKKNSKKKLKDATGLFVAKDLLNQNNLGTLYVTKINGKYNDHYDIERNVIRLSEEIYEESNMASLVTGYYQAITALFYNKNKARKEAKIKRLVIDWANKIAFFLFLLGVSSKALDVMSLSLIVMAIVIIFRYNYITKKSELISENINYLKKEYKLKKDDVEIIKKSLNTILYNELSFHIFNEKY